MINDDAIQLRLCALASQGGALRWQRFLDTPKRLSSIWRQSSTLPRRFASPGENASRLSDLGQSIATPRNYHLNSVSDLLSLRNLHNGPQPGGQPQSTVTKMLYPSSIADATNSRTSGVRSLTNLTRSGLGRRPAHRGSSTNRGNVVTMLRDGWSALPLPPFSSGSARYSRLVHGGVENRLEHDLGRELLKRHTIRSSSMMRHVASQPLGSGVRSQDNLQQDRRPFGVNKQEGPSLIGNGARSGASTTDMALESQTNQTVVLAGNLVVDGRQLGQIVASQQARSFNSAPFGSKLVNLRATPVMPGTHIPAP